MRVALVTMPVRLSKPAQVPPLGIMSLAAYLIEQGHEVRVEDAALQREEPDVISKRLAEWGAELIGLGGLVTGYGYAIRFSKALRAANPSVPLVLGGQMLINNTQNCFNAMPIDFAIHGYGEIALGKLCQHLEGELEKAHIPGLSYREGHEVVNNPGREFFKHMDDKPLPAYQLVEMDHYMRHAALALPHKRRVPDKAAEGSTKGMFVMGTLGCTDRCTFCVHEQEFVGLKRHSTEYTIRHLERLHREYGVRYFIMGEEMFLATLNGAREFNALMKERLPDCYWGATTRADVVTEALIEELRDGNCIGLHWGYESGSQQMLDLMRKRMTVETNEKAYRLCRDAGLLGSLSFMVGNVGETKRTVEETLESIGRAGISEGTVFYTSAYPGGRLWDWAVERGLIEDTHEYLLKVSNVDPEGTSNINLTPYPQWVLKVWRKMILRRIYDEALAKASEEERRQRSRLFARLRALFPQYALPMLIWFYFFYRTLTRSFFHTKRDRLGDVRRDERGALLPDRLFVARPQRHLDAEQLRELQVQPAVRLPLLQASGPFAEVKGKGA